jgi:hypothetical protein
MFTHHAPRFPRFPLCPPTQWRGEPVARGQPSATFHHPSKPSDDAQPLGDRAESWVAPPEVGLDLMAVVAGRAHSHSRLAPHSEVPRRIRSCATLQPGSRFALGIERARPRRYCRYGPCVPGTFDESTPTDACTGRASAMVGRSSCTSYVLRTDRRSFRTSPAQLFCTGREHGTAQDPCCCCLCVVSLPPMASGGDAGLLAGRTPAHRTAWVLGG